MPSRTISKYTDKYLPVDPDLIEIAQQYVKGERIGKVHYFDPKGGVGLAEGKLTGLIKSEDGLFLDVADEKVRFDKIITILGRPGAAYDEYDRFANVCFTCEDLGQFGV